MKVKMNNKKFNIIEKEFDSSFITLCENIKSEVKGQFDDLVVVNNIFLILKKLMENKDNHGNYVECGVFKGGTLIPAVTFTKNMNINFNFTGIDTFSGFPNLENDDNDLPSKFIDLYERKLISEQHFIRAKEKTDNFNDTFHLESSYFNDDFSKLFNFCDNKKNVSLLKGNFFSVLDKFTGDIDILHIDCDLYQSYKQCLEKLYDKVVSGGCIIFDEYYSLKYPGPRIFVNEFFDGKKGYFEKYITPEVNNFERWCFIKE